MKKLFYFRSLRIGFFAIAVLLQVAGSSAQTSSATAPIPVINQVSEYDINGLKVLIKRRPGTPTVAAGLFVRGGVRNITAENAGIESFMMDAATEGSKSFPNQQLRKEIARTGSSITAGANYDYSAFSLVSTWQNFERSWLLFTDVALNPAFAPADIERLKQQRLTALRAITDSPESYLETLVGKYVYAKHPYANDPDGTIETISKLKAADLAAYHQKMMQTSKLLLVVVGDVDIDALRKKITDSFGKLPRGDYKDEAPSALTFAQPAVDVATRSLPTNYVKGVFAAPSPGEPDYYAMRVAIAILQQKVFQEVRVKRNLSYAPDAGMSSTSSNTGYISVSAVNANLAVQVMLDQITQLREGTDNSITEGSIKELGSFFLTTHYLKLETNAAQAGDLASYELNGGGWKNSTIFLDKVRAVTPADVRRVANKYMKNIHFVVVGDPAQIDKKIFAAQEKPPEPSRVTGF